MDEAAQDAIVRQLEPFVHAAQDMKDVAGAAAFLRGSINDSVRSVLETGLVVSYARPFTRATLSLTGDWLSVADDDLELHEGLIQLRNKVYAHTDRTAWREAVNIGQLVGLEDNIYRQQRALLPEDGLPGSPTSPSGSVSGSRWKCSVCRRNSRQACPCPTRSSAASQRLKRR